MNKKILFPVALLSIAFVSWLIFGGDNNETVELFTSPQQGEFKVEVTSTGELRAKNSTEVRGPQAARDFRINQMKIQRLIPEGTIVKQGDFVAELDRSPILARLQDNELEVQQAESQVIQAQLDSTLTLSQARDNIINLEYALEERQIAVDQSQYESPAVQRQAVIELDRARRQLEQEKRNYETKVKQSVAKISELEAELSKDKNELSRVREVMKEFTVFAPANGMLIYKRNWDGSKVTVGSDISPWNPTVAELPDFSVMESITYVNEIDIQKIKRDQSVTVTLDAIQNLTLPGKVISVANIGEQRANSDSKVYEVVIEVTESDSLLRPAMTTSNKVLVDSMLNALYVPLETIHASDSLSFVFKKSGLSPVMQQVHLGLMNENQAVILRGIDIDDVLYLNLPSDTTGIQKVYLSEEITSLN